MSVSSRPAATKAKYSIESIEYFAFCQQVGFIEKEEMILRAE